MTARAAAREADRWLDALGLADRKTCRLDDLSHGNQQRVQLAAALLHAPELLVLDEPFSGLDPLAMEAMSSLLAGLAHDGTAVLFSSHQLDVVEHLCEDVVVINRGQVVLTGALDAIRDGAPHRYLDVTVARDPERLLHVTAATVVAHDGNRVRLRLPRHLDPVRVIADIGGDVLRLAYEPPTLSEVFHAAVSERSDREVSGVSG